MSTSSSPERVSQSEEEPRPAKRARLEQQDATKQSPQSALISTVPSHTKAEGLWLDDGSVILLAESTQFRVHRTVLSMHSPILADILNKPVGDRIEGCPVFPLSSSARDVTNFLKYLYDPLDLDTGGKVVYPVMFGVLHLSAKYGVSKLRSKSFSLLGLQVLTSLESVNKLRYAELTPEMMWWLIQAINIGREINMLELLPGAFYLCCAMPTEFILRGVSLDGVEARLSVGDRASCLLGRDRLLDVQQQETWSFLYNPQASSACTDDKRCSSRILKPLWQSCRYSPLTTPRTLSVYRYWDDLVDDKYCCRNCSDKLREDQEIAVEGAWKKLPEYFSLGSWEDLRGHGT
ncbi:hypothetical protein JAAARDRAFT_139974 [Jaapia argillacea MUCL 33604]|uniref:BTB domain-containing protein n=1 Tax=Jaapia argillacea MUCL 33604 TaxID=933084 RepID=A0A067PKL3_9AGAM|nr:hypothetical protein JAAARDRAFT_139974 [Jaapia argillacea MUCL 33604]